MDRGASITIYFYSGDGREAWQQIQWLSCICQYGCKYGDYPLTCSVKRLELILANVIASNQARFLQILVEIQLDKPIRKGSKVQGLEGDTVWIAFKYERLIGLCFSCGRLGHEVKHCGEPKDADGNGNRYGYWLKGGFWKQNTGESNYQNNPPRGLQSRTWEQGPWRLQNQASHRQIRATKTEGAIPKFQGPLWERICHRRESRT